jgi:hypothetical protein
VLSLFAANLEKLCGASAAKAFHILLGAAFKAETLMRLSHENDRDDIRKLFSSAMSEHRTRGLWFYAFAFTAAALNSV